MRLARETSWHKKLCAVEMNALETEVCMLLGTHFYLSYTCVSLY